MEMPQDDGISLDILLVRRLPCILAATVLQSSAEGRENEAYLSIEEKIDRAEASIGSGDGRLNWQSGLKRDSMMGTEQVEMSGRRKCERRCQLRPVIGSEARGEVASRMRKEQDRKVPLAVGVWHVSARARKKKQHSRSRSE